MKERWRIALLLCIMIAVLAAAGVVSMTVLYRAAVEEQKERLSEIARSTALHYEEAALLEGVLPVDGGGLDDKALHDLLELHTHYLTRTKTGEIVVARRQGDTIIFLLHKTIHEGVGPAVLEMGSTLARPTAYALAGLSGTMVGTDYRGEAVLAAYEPVPALGIGVVAKIDLAEIRAPFVRAGTTAGIIALVLAVVTSVAFIRVSAPMIRHIDESERRLRLAFDAAKAGTWEWDLRTNRNTWSDELWNLYGIKPTGAGPSYDLWKQSIHPEDREVAEAAVQNAAAGGTELYTEWRVNDPGGPERWLLSRGQPERDKEGQVVRYLGVVIDITERKRAELALRESETKYRNMIMNLSEGFYSARLDGVLLDHNAEFNRILGFPPEQDLAGTRLPDFWKNPGDRDAYLQELKREKVVRGYPTTARKSTGEEIFVEINARIVTDERDAPGHIEGSFIDVTERVRAEEAVRESAAFLDSIIDQSPFPTWISDENGTLIRINKACCDLLHITPGQVMGKYNVLEDNIVIEQGHLPAVRDVFKKGRTARFEISYDTTRVEGLDLTDNAEVTLDVTLFPVRDSAGKITNAVIQHKDVTEQKKAEDALRTNEAFTKAVLDNLPVGVAVNSVDPTVDFEYMNDNFPKFYGTTRKRLAEPDGFWAAIYEDPGFRDEIRKRVLDDCASGDPKRMFWQDVPITRKGKETRFITARNIPVPGKPLMISTVWDVTERKRAEEALRRSEVKYRTVADYNYDWEYWVGPDESVIYMSPACERITGYRPEEFVKNPGLLRSIIHPDDRESHARHERERDSRQSGQLDFRIIARDGGERWIAHACLSVFGKDGSPLGRRASNRDITERKRDEAEIRLLNEDLEQRVVDRTERLEAAVKELEAFSYSVSHDLRTPLRAIDGFTRVLVEEYDNKLDDEGRRLTGVIRDNALRMGKLIDDLLAFSRSGRGELHSGPVNMELLARSVFFELTTETERSRIDYTVDGIPETYGDNSLLRQVWTNLISNAVKFSSKADRAVIGVTGREQDGELVYSVRDNGAGFDPKYADKLFGVFQRLHGEKEFPGTGVGLAIVQRIVTRHGGRVWAEGTVGAGAEFSFSLPKQGGKS